MKAEELAALVARELGGDWCAGPGHWAMSDASDAHLNGPDGEQVHVTIGGFQHRGRIVLRGSVDQELYKHWRSYRDPNTPEITVAETKMPEQIARDVERRLLPKYRRLLAVLRERKAAADGAQAGRDTLMSELLELLGPGTEHRTHKGLNELRAGGWGNTTHATVKVGYGARYVEFEMWTISQDAARFLAAAVATAREWKSEQQDSV